MLWYHERVQGFLWIGEYIHSWIGRIDDADVGYTLTLLHTCIVFGIYGIIFTTRSPVLLFLAFLGLFLQILLNIVDNGCFMMKAERKYLGNQWFSFYTLLGDLLHVSMNRTRVLMIYYILLTVSILTILYKYILWIQKWIYFIGFVFHELKITPIMSRIASLCISILGFVFYTLRDVYTKINSFYTRFETSYETRNRNSTKELT